MLSLKFSGVLLLFVGVSICENDKMYCKASGTQMRLVNDIGMLKNCTHFEGTIRITNETFDNIEPSSLMPLKLKKITGLLIIDVHHPSFTNLSLLENLESVVNTGGSKSQFCVIIQGTLLKSIELPKLKEIECRIMIKNNEHLCYSNQWLHSGILTETNAYRSIISNKTNGNGQCDCAQECDGNLCWGPDPDQCYDLNDRFVSSSVLLEEESISIMALMSDSSDYGTLHIYEVIKKTLTIVAIILVVLTPLVFIALIFLYCGTIIRMFRNNNQIEHNFLSGTDRTPLLSQLPAVMESDIYKKNILGQGAFGTVYEGTLKCGGSSNKVPVAVKVLRAKPTADSTNKFFNEAVVMAKMDHPNIAHLIGICVTLEIMLVTKLMTLGCLLNYVRNNKHHILPKALLNWSTQIAKGMAYLEDNYLVHRDLAARNVLLESLDCVKITDFGLSTFVFANEVNSTGAKFSIHWLALECLEDNLFSHKSDVWAFGVTIWELLTFGEKPFHNIKCLELTKNLRKGLKLDQPPTCNADVYAVLLRCWHLMPEVRPNFVELENIFRKMSYDSSSYVTSYGNSSFKKLNQLEQPPIDIAWSSNYNGSDSGVRDMRDESYPQDSMQSNYSEKFYLPKTLSFYDPEGYLKPVLNSNATTAGNNSGYEIIT